MLRPAEDAAPSPARRTHWLALALLVAATFAVYLPSMQGGFIWDDDGHVTPPELQSWDGLARIWFELGASQQYYPLLHTAFWVEHRLWGDHTLGYHLVNVALHSAAACLVYVILLRLAVPGALLAAAIFVLHPVNVESVAWISEQKNTLSAVFYLSAMLVYLHFDQSRRGSTYALALALFVLGLLTKTVTASLPAAMLVVFWWQRGTLSWRRDVQPLVPFFLLGAVAGLVTAWVERNLIGAEGVEFQMSLVERGLLAGRAPWFYLSKLFWPTNLIFVYPRWELSPLVWWQWLFPAATLGMCWLLWRVRHKTRAPLAGWLLFVGTLFPVLGFFNVYPFIYSFVADHFQYLASLGIITLAAAAIVRGLAHLFPGTNWAQYAVCMGVLGTLGVLTWHQSRMYRDVVNLYQTTIDRNPECWMAHNNLGIQLARMGNRKEAIELYQTALRIKPDYAEAYNNLGVELASAGQTPQAIEHYRQAVRIRPSYFEAHNNLGSALVTAGRVNEAMPHFDKSLRVNPHFAEAHNNLANALRLQGRFEDAIGHYREALRLNPNLSEARNNLGVALFGAGHKEEAIAHFREALALDPGSADAHNSLGNSLASSGRIDEAIPEFEEALRLKPDYAEARNNLGSAYMQTGKTETAVDQYKKAIEIKPDFVQAHIHLALAYAQMNQTAEAIAAAEKALKLAESNRQPAAAQQISAWLANYRAEIAEPPDPKQPGEPHP